MILHGKKVNNGKAEGEAIVSQMPFSFLSDQDPMTGVVKAATSDIYGQSIAKKVLVIPIGKGSAGGHPYAYMAKERGNAPVAIVCVKAEPITAMVAIMNDIPMVHALDKNPLEIIKTGDRVRVDGNAGTVEILKN